MVWVCVNFKTLSVCGQRSQAHPKGKTWKEPKTARNVFQILQLHKSKKYNIKPENEKDANGIFKAYQCYMPINLKPRMFITCQFFFVW